jgi:hypothetical protein
MRKALRRRINADFVVRSGYATGPERRVRGATNFFDARHSLNPRQMHAQLLGIQARG